MICCVQWSGLCPGLVFSPEATSSRSGPHCKALAVVLVVGGGTLLTSLSERQPSMGGCTCGASLCGSMIRTKVTFTAESGTSTDVFCAVLDVLCSISHSKSYTATDIHNKRWKTKCVLVGRPKISKECSDLFLHGHKQSWKFVQRRWRKTKWHSHPVYQNYVPNWFCFSRLFHLNSLLADSCPLVE